MCSNSVYCLIDPNWSWSTVLWNLVQMLTVISMKTFVNLVSFYVPCGRSVKSTALDPSMKLNLAISCFMCFVSWIVIISHDSHGKELFSGIKRLQC